MYVYGLLIILFMDIFLVKTVYNNKSVFTTNYGVCALRIMSFFLCFISPGFFFFHSLSFFPIPLFPADVRTAVNEKSQLLPKKSAL